MFQTKKTLLFAFILCIIALGVQSFKKQEQQQEPTLKNIKVLPPNFTFKQVDEVMDKFKAALGVRCGYCHAPMKDNPRRFDMASDENPKKEVARDMIRMTFELNQKFFADSLKVGVMKVTCYTCHHGEAKPPIMSEVQEEHQGPPPAQAPPSN